MNADGKMDKNEFSIAMHLISKKLQHMELPRVLPASMKQDPLPAGGTMASGSIPPAGMMPGGFATMGMTPMGGGVMMGQPAAQMGMQPRMPMQMGK